MLYSIVSCIARRNACVPRFQLRHPWDFNPSQPPPKGNVNRVDTFVSHQPWGEFSYLEVVKREDQRKRRQRLLPSREVGDVLPRFLGRANAEDDALAERVQRVHQLQLRVATQSDHLGKQRRISGVTTGTHATTERAPFG